MKGKSSSEYEKVSEDVYYHFEDVITSKVSKEWKRKGIKTRDWVKTKVVFFDSDGKP